MSPPRIDEFLGDLVKVLLAKDGIRLQQALILEPPLPPFYNAVVSELRQVYPASSQANLEKKIGSFIPERDEDNAGGSRAAFNAFVVRYFSFLRDVNVDNLLETHDLLKALLRYVLHSLSNSSRLRTASQCVLALSSPMGLVVLPTVVSLSRTLARLAIGLDKRPELIQHLSRRESTVGGEEGAERVTLVEGSANTIREAFSKCLSERSGNASGVDSNGRPEGRRIGIYMTANLCLKLFFQCRKLRSAEQVFGNIYSQSPPLSLFPASQRVTFLYYLGRYHFANNHFFRAQNALQGAYDQCHVQALRQRRLILIYLIAANVILGRFPSSRLLQRPEASGLQEKFGPLCRAIVRGDLASFRQYLDMDGGNADWFLSKRILLQLSNRCETLVWRSFARRTFVLFGFQGDVANKKAPTLSLQDMRHLAIFLEKKALGLIDKAPKLNGLTDGQFGAVTQPRGYTDPDLLDVVDPAPPLLPTMEVVESIVASLVEQDLLHGFISHSQQRFAITGVKGALPVEVGFPGVWDVTSARADGEVPGWVREKKKIPAYGGKFGPGMVVNLSGARPAGSGPA